MTQPGDRPPGFVPETRFGSWFLRTRIWSRYVLEPALAELAALPRAPLPPLARVLELGCGEGRALAWIARTLRPGAIVGVDADPAAVAVARGLAAGLGLRAEIRVGTATKLELPDTWIDLVLCHQTLHHVEDPAAALHEVHRVLRPGGVLLAAESCRAFLRRAWVRVGFRHPRGAARTPEEWLELVRAAGLRVGPDESTLQSPWWSRRDLGLGERLGWRARPGRPATQILLAAHRPA